MSYTGIFKGISNFCMALKRENGTFLITVTTLNLDHDFLASPRLHHVILEELNAVSSKPR